MKEAIQYLHTIGMGNVAFQDIYEKLKELGLHHQEATLLGHIYAEDVE